MPESILLAFPAGLKATMFAAALRGATDQDGLFPGLRPLRRTCPGLFSRSPSGGRYGRGASVLICIHGPKALAKTRLKRVRKKGMGEGEFEARQGLKPTLI